MDQRYKVVGQTRRYLAIYESRYKTELAASTGATSVPNMARDQINRHIVFRPLSG
jgi:hypothetical protein